jgi:glucose-1-phosphate thymidylyltransferase
MNGLNREMSRLEGIAYRNGRIVEVKMWELARPMLKNQYGQYQLKVIDDTSSNFFRDNAL